MEVIHGKVREIAERLGVSKTAFTCCWKRFRNVLKNRKVVVPRFEWSPEIVTIRRMLYFASSESKSSIFGSSYMYMMKSGFCTITNDDHGSGLMSTNPSGPSQSLTISPIRKRRRLHSVVVGGRRDSLQLSGARLNHHRKVFNCSSPMEQSSSRLTGLHRSKN